MGILKRIFFVTISVTDLEKSSQIKVYKLTDVTFFQNCAIHQYS